LPSLSDALKETVEKLFDAMDANKDGKLVKEEAIKFWDKNFAKINAGAMFNEVDVDKNGEVSKAEWVTFWQNVVHHGYKEEEVMEEVTSMLESKGSWVDWDDGRST